MVGLRFGSVKQTDLGVVAIPAHVISETLLMPMAWAVGSFLVVGSNDVEGAIALGQIPLAKWTRIDLWGS